MAEQMSMPGVFGGLMRYNEEYQSKLKIKPAYAIAIILLLAIGVVALNLFFSKVA